MLLRLCDKSKPVCRKSLGGGKKKGTFIFLAGEKGTEPFLWVMEEPLHHCWGGWAELAVIYSQCRDKPGGELAQNKLCGELAGSFGFMGSSWWAGQADLRCCEGSGGGNPGKSPCRSEPLCLWLSRVERLEAWLAASPAGHCCPLVQAS